MVKAVFAVAGSTGSPLALSLEVRADGAPNSDSSFDILSLPKAQDERGSPGYARGVADEYSGLVILRVTGQ